MKILTIGDIHGHDNWKEIINSNTNTFDKIVFIGDYLDSFSVSLKNQLSNLLDILEYKRSYPDNVILLIGNHELHYLNGIDFKYSGFDLGYNYTFNPILEEALKDNLLQIAFKDNYYLFTHAGVSKTWCVDNNINYTSDYIDDELNLLFNNRRISYHISDGGYGYGDEINQSPLWIRPNSLYNDSVDFINVIGHTHRKIIEVNDKFILTDTLPYEYIIIDTETNEHKIIKI